MGFVSTIPHLVIFFAQQYIVFSQSHGVRYVNIFLSRILEISLYAYVKQVNNFFKIIRKRRSNNFLLLVNVCFEFTF
jgi:hypothetical protein